jgi:lipoate-protein ligase A
VTNIRALNPDTTFEQVNEAIADEFVDFYGGSAEIEEINPMKLQNNPELSRYYAQLSDWKWRYGKTPEFQHFNRTRFDWGQFDVHIESKQGMIDKVKLFSDCLNPGIVEELERNLLGQPYTSQGILAACNRAGETLSATDPQIGKQVAQFRDWLTSEL